MLERRLLEYYLEGGTARTTPLPFRVGGDWFCPVCGVKASEGAPGDIQCPSCERSLVEFIHALVELHPHRGPMVAGDRI
jgi:rubrerythrin